MAKVSLVQKPFLDGFHHDFDGTILREETEIALVAVSVPLGGEAEFSGALKAGYQAEMPDHGNSTISADGAHRIIRFAPDQVFVVFQHADPDASAIVSEKFGAAGYVVDQTHNWVALSLDGAVARSALERICAVNLHREKFSLNKAERTVMEHMGALIIRTGEDAFLLLSAASSGKSFLHAVETSIKYVS